MPAPLRKGAAPPPQQAAPPPRINRMTLGSIRRGVSTAPRRTTLYGVEGIGKTSFGADAPQPIFIGAEEGFGLLDVERFPQPERFDDVLDAIYTLRHEKHDHKTLVIDTLDWLEPLIHKFICERDNQENVEAYGYGKGWNVALDEWRVFTTQLDFLRADTGMEVLLIAHSWIKNFKNPEGDDYDRYELKINNKAAGLIKEWSDVVLFTNYETYANKDTKTKRVRGVSTGSRLCYASRTAAFDAKNRYGLPDEFPLGWADYQAALSGEGRPQAETLVEEIQRKAAELGGDIEAQTLAFLEQHQDDEVKLQKINNRLNARLHERAEVRS